MEQYAYLFFGLIFLLAAASLLLLRRDLIKLAPKLIFIGASAGALAEIFYFRDYWRPPTLLGQAKISLEDFLVGAAVTIIVAFAYPVLKGKTFVRSSSLLSQKKTFYLLLIGGIVMTLILNVRLGINSVFVTSAICLAVTAGILCYRKDLISLALTSAFLFMGLAFVIYAVVFNVFAPDFWDKYWLLSDTNYGATILGNVPMTEMLWYFTWGLLGSVCYPFVSGRVLADREQA